MTSVSGTANPAAWMSCACAVRNPLELSLADIRALPRRSHAVTLECAGNGRVGLMPLPTVGVVARRKDQETLLRAAALTYVAASLMSLLNVARWWAILRR